MPWFIRAVTGETVSIPCPPTRDVGHPSLSMEGERETWATRARRNKAIVHNLRELLSKCYSPSMDLETAKKSAQLIVEQERQAPSSVYTFVGKTLPTNVHFHMHDAGNQNPRLAGIYALKSMRQQSPREVWERPEEWQFSSRNYELLTIILSQLETKDKISLLATLIAAAIAVQPVAAAKPTVQFPSWENNSSELALLLEICVRNNYFHILFSRVANLSLPVPCVAIMLMQLEEMLALNFNVFSNDELEKLPLKLAPIRAVAETQTWKYRRTLGGIDQEFNTSYRGGLEKIGNQIVKSVDSIKTQVQRALYLYVEGILRQIRNPEVEGDKVKVVAFLDTLGFNPL
ncbi:MAG TPA: hypothetical protein VFA15_01770, partial [Nitrososphaera sp.]|nr:hypothetical protein [Nitrososphaera sp.]